jgi:hypothetical protein
MAAITQAIAIADPGGQIVKIRIVDDHGNAHEGALRSARGP